MNPLKAFYGFSEKLPSFAGKSAAEQVALLQAWGANAVFGGYEQAGFIEAAHEAGLRVYAEFACFSGQHWWEEVPESRPITASGAPLEPVDWYYGVNPSQPEVRSRQLDALEKLLQDHDVDGVWLDFIRWPCRWEKAQPALVQTSFDAPTIAQFCSDTGIDAHDAEDILKQHMAAWADWKCQQITDWVRQARACVERVRPGTTLGLFGIPWRQDDHAGAIRTIIGQDFGALAASIDIFSPMTYHEMCSQSVSWIASVAEEVQRITAKPTCPIVQSVPETLPSAEYEAALHTALQSPAGAIIFTLEGALAGDHLAVTQRAFRP
ncbi:MAG: hypothetical protein K8L99_34380 [Anaerolineae bacterium]|nr:hypothetical protein [Anaerolineae bacterium]